MLVVNRRPRGRPCTRTTGSALLNAMSQAPLVRLPLLEHYLREQQSTTAVDRFARLSEAGQLQGQSRYGEQQLLGELGPGRQLAFEVDLDVCTGCKACVTGCHHMNGLDAEEAETWRWVGLLQGG